MSSRCTRPDAITHNQTPAASPPLLHPQSTLTANGPALPRCATRVEKTLNQTNSKTWILKCSTPPRLCFPHGARSSLRSAGPPRCPRSMELQRGSVSHASGTGGERYIGQSWSQSISHLQVNTRTHTRKHKTRTHESRHPSGLRTERRNGPLTVRVGTQSSMVTGRFSTGGRGNMDVEVTLPVATVLRIGVEVCGQHWYIRRCCVWVCRRQVTSIRWTRSSPHAVQGTSEVCSCA